MGPDERVVRAHLEGGAFRAGVADGYWDVLEIDWPHAVFSIAAAPREDSPAEFALRLELNDYPTTAPTGCLWDVDAKTWLAPELRPKGTRVQVMFRTDAWPHAPGATYAPWDRAGLLTHPEWAQQHAQQAWNPKRNITFVLSNDHDALNSREYLGI
jgi:hypothetical protein